MKCWVEKPGGGKCGSTQHLSRDCPFNKGKGKGASSSSTLWGEDDAHHTPTYTNDPNDVWHTEVYMIDVKHEVDLSDNENDDASTRQGGLDVASTRGGGHSINHLRPRNRR